MIGAQDTPGQPRQLNAGRCATTDAMLVTHPFIVHLQ